MIANSFSGRSADRFRRAEAADMPARREVLAGLCAALGSVPVASLLAAVPLRGLGAAPSAGPAMALRRNVRFHVFIGSDRIGRHDVTFEQSEEGLVVRTDADLLVRRFGVALYLYRQHTVEFWVGDHLQRFDSDTTEDDARFIVEGRAVAGGLEVVSKKDRRIAPAATMLATFWRPEICRQSQLIEPKRGRLRSQMLHGVQQFEREWEGIAGPVTVYRISGLIEGACAYDGEGQWVGARMRKLGAEVSYRAAAG